MADKKPSTVLKKNKRVDIKSQKGNYSYEFTTIAEIHRYLEETEQHYEAYIAPEATGDYMFIQKLTKDGEPIGHPLRGTKIPQVPDLKAYGGTLTTCRRYSLLMAYGLACGDNDEPIQERRDTTPAKERWKQLHTANPNNPVTDNQKLAIRKLCEGLGKESVETLRIITSAKNAAQASQIIRDLNAEKVLLEESKNGENQ